MRRYTHQSRLPREARSGLMRAWVAILRARHPNVMWIPVEENRSWIRRRPPRRSRHEEI
jgi:hypothetical protein